MFSFLYQICTLTMCLVRENLCNDEVGPLLWLHICKPELDLLKIFVCI